MREIIGLIMMLVPLLVIAWFVREMMKTAETKGKTAKKPSPKTPSLFQLWVKTNLDQLRSWLKTETNNKKEEDEEKKRFFWKVFFAVNLLLLVTEILLWEPRQICSVRNMFAPKGTPAQIVLYLSWGKIMAFFHILYLIRSALMRGENRIETEWNIPEAKKREMDEKKLRDSKLGFSRVKAGDIGALYFIERPLFNIKESGFVFVPFGLCKLIVIKEELIQMEIPAEPDKVYRGTKDDPDGKNTPEGMKPPIRIPQRGIQKEEKDYDQRKNDSLETAMTNEFSFIIPLWPKDLIVFIKKVGSFENAFKILYDEVVKIAPRVLSQQTPRETLNNWKDTSERINADVQEIIDNWGVDSDEIGMKSLDLGKKVNEAMKLIATAISQKQADIIAAEGLNVSTNLASDSERYKAEQKGRGDALAIEEKKKAEAKGYEEIKKVLGVSGEEILNAETNRHIAESVSNLNVFNDGNKRSLLGTVGKITQVVKNIPEKGK